MAVLPWNPCMHVERADDKFLYSKSMIIPSNSRWQSGVLIFRNRMMFIEGD
jgi:hypothetical protein